MKKQHCCFLSVIFLLAVCTRGYKFPDFGDYDLDKENYNNDFNEWDATNYDKKLRDKKPLHETEPELYGKEEQPEPEPEMGKAEKVEQIKEKLVEKADMKDFKSKKETPQGRSMSDGRSVSAAKTTKKASSKKTQSKHQSTKKGSKTPVAKKSSKHKKPSTKPSVKKQQKGKVVIKTDSINATGSKNSKKLETKKKSETPKIKSKTKKSSHKKVNEKHQKKKTSGKVNVGDIGLVGLQVLMALFVVLASVVIVLNSLALWTLFIDSSADKLKFNVLKSWLTILDFMSGVYVFAVIVPNVFWTIDNHFKSEDLSQLKQPHSVSSNALGAIFLFLFVASLYVTSYLALWRYSSLRNRHDVENMTVNRMRFNISLCILLALVVSTFPLWFPKHFAFDYQHNIFVCWFESLGKSTFHFSVSVCLLLSIVLPMLAIIFITIITWILTKKNTDANIGDIEYIDEEVSLTKATSFMGIGFVLLVFPFLLVSYLYVGKIISYEKTYVAHIVLFFVFCCRSLLNVGVYTVTSVQDGGSLSKTFGHERSSNQKFMGLRSDEEEPMLQESDN